MLTLGHMERREWEKLPGQFSSILGKHSNNSIEDFFFTITVKSSWFLKISLSNNLFSLHNAKSVLVYSSAAMPLSIFPNYYDRTDNLTAN